jgi:hypothetical protein
MSINVETMIDEVYAHCGIDEDDLARTVVLLQLNKSFWELMNKFKFRENEVSGSFSLIANQPRYTFPTLFEAVRGLSIIDPTTSQSYVINQTNFHYYDTVLNTDETIQYGQPKYYWRENDEVVFWPTPEKVYECTLRYIVTLSDLVDDSGNFPPIPQEWHEIILLGGVYRTFGYLGDSLKADTWKSTQLGMINSTVPVEAIELADTKYARMVPVRPMYNPGDF